MTQVWNRQKKKKEACSSKPAHLSLLVCPSVCLSVHPGDPFSITNISQRQQSLWNHVTYYWGISTNARQELRGLHLTIYPNTQKLKSVVILKQALLAPQTIRLCPNHPATLLLAFSWVLEQEMGWMSIIKQHISQSNIKLPTGFVTCLHW